MKTCLWCGKSEHKIVHRSFTEIKPVVLAFGICERCRRKTLMEQRNKNIPIRKAKNPKKYKYLNVNY